MKNDQIVFEKTKNIAHDINQMQNQQEIIDYLFRQDSLTLNQLKHYYSEPSLPLQFLVKVAVLCMFISMTLVHPSKRSLHQYYSFRYFTCSVFYFYSHLYFYDLY